MNVTALKRRDVCIHSKKQDITMQFTPIHTSASLFSIRQNGALGLNSPHANTRMVFTPKSIARLSLLSLFLDVAFV